jgi:hypothetical protein
MLPARSGMEQLLFCFRQRSEPSCCEFFESRLLTRIIWHEYRFTPEIIVDKLGQSADRAESMRAFDRRRQLDFKGFVWCAVGDSNSGPAD